MERDHSLRHEGDDTVRCALELAKFRELHRVVPELQRHKPNMLDNSDTLPEAEVIAQLDKNAQAR